MKIFIEVYAVHLKDCINCMVVEWGIEGRTLINDPLGYFSEQTDCRGGRSGIAGFCDFRSELNLHS